MGGVELSLERVGVNVGATEPTELFKMAMALRDIALELEWRFACRDFSKFATVQ